MQSLHEKLEIHLDSGKSIAPYIILIEVSFDHRTGPQTLCHLFDQHRLQVLLQLSITYCWFLQCLVQYLHHRLLSTQVLPIKGGKYDSLEVNG